MAGWTRQHFGTGAAAPGAPMHSEKRHVPSVPGHVPAPFGPAPVDRGVAPPPGLSNGPGSRVPQTSAGFGFGFSGSALGGPWPAESSWDAPDTTVALTDEVRGPDTDWVDELVGSGSLAPPSWLDGASGRAWPTPSNPPSVSVRAGLASTSRPAPGSQGRTMAHRLVTPPPPPTPPPPIAAPLPAKPPSYGLAGSQGFPAPPAPAPGAAMFPPMVSRAPVRGPYAEPSGPAASSGPTGEDLDSQALDLYKSFRKLNKKLRQIDLLRDKAGTGSALDEQQRLKLRTAPETRRAFDRILVHIFYSCSLPLREKVLEYVQCGVNGHSKPPPQSMDSLADMAKEAKLRLSAARK